ncbi:hypothetical protein HDV57DRAFT_414478 [Trichoderma longibrachiatum]
MGFGCGLQLEIGVGVGVFLVRLVDPIPSGRSAPQAPFHVSACFGDRVAKRRDAKKGTGSLGNFGNYLFSIVSESELVGLLYEIAHVPAVCSGVSAFFVWLSSFGFLRLAFFKCSAGDGSFAKLETMWQCCSR